MVYFPDNYFEKEIRNGFEVSSMMKRAWAGQIEVLSVIREICERHNILWFADYGTLLGAVRHKGFIPWDDDMDIGMTRDNLNNFIKYAKDELPDEYKLLCMDLEPRYIVPKLVYLMPASFPRFLHQYQWIKKDCINFMVVLMY